MYEIKKKTYFVFSLYCYKIILKIVEIFRIKLQLNTQFLYLFFNTLC